MESIDQTVLFSVFGCLLNLVNRQLPSLKLELGIVTAGKPSHLTGYLKDKGERRESKSLKNRGTL